MRLPAKKLGRLEIAAHHFDAVRCVAASVRLARDADRIEDKRLLNDVDQLTPAVVVDLEGAGFVALTVNG